MKLCMYVRMKLHIMMSPYLHEMHIAKKSRATIIRIIYSYVCTYTEHII